MKKLNKNQKGFTIIEVLIVLAIAGLIMLIVFLAVPALQRNSRNTQAKNEAASIIGAVNEFVNNNNGAVVVSGDSASILGNANTKEVTTLTIEQDSGTTAPTSSVAVLRIGATCNSPSGDATTGQAPSNRQYALVYQIEDSGGALIACQES